ncbi:methyltransferase domain-containing protein [Colletotrichum tofieldiae]|nr:methyltransferase domain-containing protein [Colletotrichum tofieldiae]
MDMVDLQHHICLLTLGGSLGLAPPCQPGVEVGRVLDIGTGTGIWAMQFGDDHPEADVLGVDLSAIQPEFTGPNVQFEIDDLEEEWTYSQPFDYIHSRFMTSSIANWKDLLTKSFNNLNPGGYIELQEPDLFAQSDDDSLPSDCALNRYCKLLSEAMAKLGREYVSVPALKTLMEEIGFVDVTLSCYKWPMNTWPKDNKYKELGSWNYENISQAAEALAMAPLTRAFDWSRDEVNVFLIDVRKDLKNRNYHAYFPVYFVVGRKPEEEEEAEPEEEETSPAA